VPYKTLSPAHAPARLRLGKAFAGLLLSALALVPGEDWVARALPMTAPVVSALGMGPGAALAASTPAARTRARRSRRHAGSTARHATAGRAATARTGHLGRRHHSLRRGRASNGVNARAAFIVDAQSGEVLYDKNSATAMPIASLTKLMTAIVYLDSQPDLEKRAMVAREDLEGSGKTQLRAGEVLTMRDLLHMSLLSSDNAATRAIVRNSGLPPEEYLARMNKKAQVMGLTSTRFVEFTGLSEENVSSAAEYAQILKTASQHPMIAEITTLPDYTFRSSSRQHHLVNTNRLCRFGVFDVKAGKTGHINEAGYCLATWVSTQSRDVLAVVLGAPSNAGRFAVARRLIDKVALAPVGAPQAGL
jgi:D-alanyl-D-alanine endopeptidase (penicillin-binding protein 7)